MKYFHIKTASIILSVLSACTTSSKVKSNLSDLRNRNDTQDLEVFIDSLMDNNRIDYSYVLMSCDTCVPISTVGYRVVVNLDSTRLNLLKNLTPEKWNSLLKDSSMDWAANLILYSINDIDAFTLSGYKDKYKWREYMKKRDLEFWVKWFQK